MSVPGTGIRTIADIEARCIVDDCWIWQGAYSHADQRGVPIAWFPAAGRLLNVSRMAWLLTRETPLPMKYQVWRTCRNAGCVNPEHLKAGTKAQWGAWLARSGLAKGDPRRPMINRRNRERDSTLTMELAQWVRESDQTGVEVAHALGVAPTAVSRVRTGKTWRRLAKSASIFSLADHITARAQMRRAA